MDISDIISLARNVDKKISTSYTDQVDKKKKKKKKRARNAANEENIAITKRPRSSQHTIFDDADGDDIANMKSVNDEVEYPYEVNPDDHCETKADG